MILVHKTVKVIDSVLSPSQQFPGWPLHCRAKPSPRGIGGTDVVSMMQLPRSWKKFPLLVPLLLATPLPLE